MAKRRNRFQRIFIEDNPDVIEEASFVDIDEKEFPKKKRLKKKYKKEKFDFENEFEEEYEYI